MKASRERARLRRHQRIRKKILGTNQRPRLCIHKSLQHLTAQLIDDTSGKTLIGLSTFSKELRGKIKRGNREGAKILGQTIGQKIKAMNVAQVIFDRGGYIYHGRIHEFAEGVRKAGLKF